MRFVSEGPAYKPEGQAFYRADIHCMGEISWLSRINIWGDTAEDAERLRERVLWSLSHPDHPEIWQYQDKDDPAVWHTADVGAIVRAKANGYNTRGLYLKSVLHPPT